MIAKPIAKITAQDIDALATDQVTESRSLDYKLTFPTLAKDSDKREFVADILAFANTVGGDLVFGMNEAKDPETGGKLAYPEPAVGVEVRDRDELRRQIESIARDQVDPRLVGLQLEYVGAYANGPVVVLRVPKSPAGPHVSRMDHKFYARSEGGKFQLNVQQVRTAFVEGAEVERAARRFRGERVALVDARNNIDAFDAALPLGLKIEKGDSILVVHVVASSFTDPTKRMNLAAMKLGELLPPQSHQMRWATRFNADGAACWLDTIYGSGSASPNAALGYLQVFRSGAVEVVDFYHPNAGDQRNVRGGDFIRGDLIEVEIVNSVAAALRVFEAGGASFPAFVFVSLLDVKGKSVERSRRVTRNPAAYAIDRRAVLLADVLIESADADLEAVLRPICDDLWQASGFERSPMYDENGRRRATRPAD